MTNEQATNKIKEHLEHWERLLKENICEEQDGTETVEAFKMAIAALKQDACEKNMLDSLFKNIKMEKEADNVQLVIDFDREKYLEIMDHFDTFPKQMREYGVEAIKNGTVLPKNRLKKNIEKVEKAPTPLEADQDLCKNCLFEEGTVYCREHCPYEAETEQDPCDTCIYEEGSKYCIEHCPYEAKTEQEPRDAISREDARMSLTCEIKEGMTIEDYISMVDKRLRKLPPVQPSLNGHWIIDNIKDNIPKLSHYQSDDGQDLVMVYDVLRCIDEHTKGDKGC